MKDPYSDMMWQLVKFFGGFALAIIFAWLSIASIVAVPVYFLFFH